MPLPKTGTTVNTTLKQQENLNTQEQEILLKVVQNMNILTKNQEQQSELMNSLMNKLELQKKLIEELGKNENKNKLKNETEELLANVRELVSLISQSKVVTEATGTKVLNTDSVLRNSVITQTENVKNLIEMIKVQRMTYKFSEHFDEKVANSIEKVAVRLIPETAQKVTEDFKISIKDLSKDMNNLKNEISDISEKSKKQIEQTAEKIKESNTILNTELEKSNNILKIIEIINSIAWTMLPITIAVMIVWAGIFSMVANVPDNTILAVFYNFGITILSIIMVIMLGLAILWFIRLFSQDK